MKGVKRFGVKGKLSPRYIGPFKILSQNRTIAYALELPSRLAQVHNVFHVSQLRKCLKVLDDAITHQEIELQADLIILFNIFGMLQTSLLKQNLVPRFKKKKLGTKEI